MKKIVLVMVLLLLLDATASAQKSVYIAGNPQMEPFEYYDQETATYKGILPRIYEQLSRETGIEFHYHMPNKGNQQNHFARNRQVELISAHWMGTIDGIEEELLLCTFEKEGVKRTLSIGFTPNMPEETAELIRTAFSEFTEEEKLYQVISEYERVRRGIPIAWAAFLAGVLIIVIFFLLFLWLRDREYFRKKEQLLKLDTLTGQGNRTMYEQEFETVITAESMGLYYVAYIGADMRRYPGSVDSVQCRTAQILSAETQEYEFIARVGEDSFIFVFQALNSGSAMDRISDLMARLNRESSLPRKMRYRAGVYVITDYKTTPNAALRDARRGWLFAEKKGEDCCLVDQAALEKAEKVARFERTLHKALEHQEFKMYMRFVETAKGGKICGAEARSRWQNPREGTIKRADYINVMIEAHIIDRMDFYLLERVCEQLEEWNGTEYESLFISCEIREQTILRKDFVKQLLKITSSYHFDYKNLVLELSEAILVSEGERLKSNVFACHTAGFRVALGSFGSSQTSLMDFYDYLLDIVKVDAKLTKKVKLSKGKILLRNMIRMAHDLKMEVLCQGVDNTEQLEAVAKLDCDYVQNEVASKELPQDVAMEYLEKRSKEKLLSD